MSQTQASLSCAVITGAHSFDVPGFHALFRALPGVDATIQHLDDFAASPEAVRDGYDCVIFYFMPLDGPTDDLPWHQGKPRSALERLVQTGQGIVILHHGLLAYRSWPFWDDLTGIGGRDGFGYHPNQSFRVEVADPGHPITREVAAWTMSDETYTLPAPDAASHVLLTVDHEKCMKQVGWTRQVGASRVFCLSLGHDRAAWEDPSFREVLQRGIGWSAVKL
jgi:hypothetical protein